MNQALSIFTVDAFSGAPYRGNPAAVCILPEPRPDSWMRDVAREMNLSETAFLRREEEFYRLRWFTPAVEVDLCGHATLAAAHVLWEQGFLKPGDRAVFETASGCLGAEKKEGWITLDFPSEPAQAVPEPDGLARALGADLKAVGRNRLDVVAEVASASVLRGLKPDLALLSAVPCRGVIATCADESGKFDYLCRCFAPRAGIPEDPATGSAQCALGLYWGERLGKKEMTVFQASERGGVIRVRPGPERTLISGQAVTVLRGELLF